jgi:hypothetical protein
MFFETPMLGNAAARRPQQEMRFEETAPTAGHNLKAAEKTLGSDILTILEQHYPSHFWRVVVDIAQGIAHVSIPILMGPVAKYILHLDRILSVPDLKRAVVTAGGEILERWKIPRGGLDLGLSEFLSARERRLILPSDPMPT